MKNALILCLSIIATNGVLAQFSGPADSVGSNAIYKDSNVFVNWATSCVADLGLVDISNSFSGTASNGDETSPIGFPDGATLSLGDSGIATLTFSAPITNGFGADFAVFENSFSDNFLELAFVEVSSDGINFHRFHSTSNTQTNNQIGPFDATTDPTHLNNLAGKYRANYGTPFDLEELTGIFGLNTQAITHIRIIDVIGDISGNHTQQDANGQAINDPFPTPFPSCGFDLDAIGVIHQAEVGVEELGTTQLSIYPNPICTGKHLFVESLQPITELSIYDLSGNLLLFGQSNSIKLDGFDAGMYVLKILVKDQVLTRKIIVK